MSTFVKRRSGFTLVELLVVIAVIGVLVGLLLPAVQAAREAARRMECTNHLRQMGLAIHNYELANRQIPSGWVANNPHGEPGWGWAAALLPFMEATNLYNQIDFRLPIEHAVHDQVRTSIVPTLLCPSDTGGALFAIAAGDGHDHDHRPVMHARSIDDDEPKLFSVAKSNFVGMFGTRELESAPYAGDGTFFGNSRIKFRDITDGLSNTLIVGERNSLLGGSVWLGNIPDAAEPHARILGVADHGPNDPHAHFEDFSSYHSGGVNFMRGDVSVRFLADSIDLRVYQAMATRSGGEVSVAIE